MPPKKKQKTPVWKPLPPNDKHLPGQPGKLSEGFPKRSLQTIENSDNRSFWKFAFHLQYPKPYDCSAESGRTEERSALILVTGTSHAFLLIQFFESKQENIDTTLLNF
jgi:hypothetical protein